MFCNITGELAEFWVFLDELLHVRNGFHLHVALPFRGILLDIFFRILAQVAKIEIHVLLEEWILILLKGNLLQTVRSMARQFHFKKELTLSSGRTSGTSLRSTLPSLMPISSWTIAWYVHCVRSGVTGSSRRSTIRSMGGVSIFRNSKSWSSCVI